MEVVKLDGQRFPEYVELYPHVL